MYQARPIVLYSCGTWEAVLCHRGVWTVPKRVRRAEKIAKRNIVVDLGTSVVGGRVSHAHLCVPIVKMAMVTKVIVARNTVSWLEFVRFARVHTTAQSRGVGIMVHSRNDMFDTRNIGLQ